MKTPPELRSLAEVHRSVRIPAAAGFFRKLFAFSGPGYLVAVGYMDPGNWATSLAGGSAFGYTLLSVVLLSSLTAILLQALAARLGVATGQDLAQACRANYRPRVSFALWVLAEIAICACDLAELLGSAVALNLLFDIPLLWGVLITTLDVFLILFLQRRGFRVIESIVIAMILVVGVSFAYEIVAAHPDWAAVAGGLAPRTQIITDPAMLYVAIGILGATVMPHNLYLHSAVVQTRAFGLDPAGKREAIRFATIDSPLALTLAFFVNGAILVLAAATFHGTSHQIAEIQDAYRLLTPTLGVAAASTLFAVALLASGQNSTLTGTLAGQIVMEGFLRIRLTPWLRRLVTRLIAVVPAIVVTALYGNSGVASLLVLSQVVLSLQLPFAIVPLVRFTTSRTRMGEFVSPQWLGAVAWLIAAAIIALNMKLLYDVVSGD